VRTRALGSIAAAFAALVAVGSGEGATVTVLVRPDVSLDRYAHRGAVGLLIPGSGPTVTRRGALAALVRGRVVNSVVSSAPGGEPSIALGRRPGDTTVYVSLPAPGRHHNTRRYPVAIVGGGYRGLLVSDTTHIPGLVSIADIAPTVRALARGGRPLVRWRDDRDAAADLGALDRHLGHAHDERDWATVALVVLASLLVVAAFILRSALAGRAALLVPAAMVAVALVFSALDVTEPLTLLGLAAGAGALAFVGGRSRRSFTFAVGAFLVAFLCVLVAWPEVNALAVIGPHPDGGVRFYGVTNEVETILLAPVVAAVAAAGGGAAIALGELALVTIGWSRAGADGGGLVVYAVALALVALLRVRPDRGTLLRVGLPAAAAALGLAYALVRLDASTGGSSHVTRAVGGGSGSLAGDVLDRLHVSWAGATSSLHTIVLVVLSLGALAWLAVRAPRTPALTSFLVAIGVSLIVNDTPADVAVSGAIACAALWAWERAEAGTDVGTSALSRAGSPAAARRPSRPRTPATR
jgi:hypothetical protein